MLLPVHVELTMKKIILIIGLFCALFSNAALANVIAENEQEREMLRIANKLRCAVCQNQPVSESRSGLANDMKVIIREQLAAGKSEKEIIDYFVDRYGDYVLLKPRKTGTGFPLWVLPPLLLVIAAVFAWMVMRRRKELEPPTQSKLSDEDRERIRRAREEEKNDEDDKQ